MDRIEYEILRLVQEMLTNSIDILSVLSAEFVVSKVGEDTPTWVKIIAGGNLEMPDMVADVATDFYFSDLLIS